MAEEQIMINEMKEAKEAKDGHGNNTNTNEGATECAAASRKERRKAAKKEKRKKKRKEMADMARREEEARLNDPEELLRLQAEEEQEKLRAEKERMEFEERERKILEGWERKRAQEQREEEERRRKSEEEEHQSKQNQVGCENELNDDAWEYMEEGPPEIIWQGNEIIVKKKRIRVKKKDTDLQKEDPNRPTSNPLPPQSEAFANYTTASILSAQQLLENVAQETPNFGTEQDKAHCPFHLKTGACRFGSRCSRIHFYPDKSCTLLIKNMYNGPGLAWEQDEGLEYTEEEVELAYEEFYEDVHTEFLKFGEIVNFKVCRNGSSHLRGNLYVHYKSLDSAVLAYQSVNGRYFAGKQVQCEFVGVTRWKVAICGEFMKSKLQTCSRGTACNFIHCFRNPGGDYEWADWDKPPPRYWLKKMAALFGCSDESGYAKQIDRESPRYHSRRSRSREIHYSRSSRNYSEDDCRSCASRSHHRIADRKQSEVLSEKQCDAMSNSREKDHTKYVSSDSDSDRNRLERDRRKNSSKESSRNQSQSRSWRDRKSESRSGKSNDMSIHESDLDENTSGSNRDNIYHHGHSRRSRRHQDKRYEIVDGSRGAGTEGEWLDKGTVKVVYHRGGPSNARKQNKASTSPDDHWDVRGNLIDEWYDDERESAHIYEERSARSDGTGEFEDTKLKRQDAHKLKYSNDGPHLGRGSEELEYYRGSPGDCGRSYRSSDSSTRYYSRKDTGLLERNKSKKQVSDRPKRLKRRGTDKNFDSKPQIEYNEVESDETTDKRGRWEPDR